MTRWRLLILPLLLTLGGCETVSGWFDDEDEDPFAPVELTDLDVIEAEFDRRWSLSVGDGEGDGLYHINPLLEDGIVYVASSDGVVMAVDADSGKRLWETELALALSGGMGKYEDSLFAGGEDGLVLRLRSEDGTEVWRVEVTGEVLAAPQSNGEVVVAQTYDGRLFAFDYETGERLWSYISDVPVLTLRGTSTPRIIGRNAVAGFADGKLVAIDLRSGNVSWEARIAIPQGRSEIERIVDIDGNFAIQGSELFVASYQGRLVALETSAGRKLWQRNVSSVSGVSLGFGNVYVADEDGTVSAFLRNGQGVRWQNIDLGYRGLSRPTPVSSYVAVGDFEGYVHLFSQVDGRIVGRTRVDSDGIRADMIGTGNRLIVYGNGGELAAYDIVARD
ncbi:MAG: outer membrane protein assembly factor BamB [Halieaceae bacterium]|nr:outer membrane protein assembly factor BamB [Halieaceae bacterium]